MVPQPSQKLTSEMKLQVNCWHQKEGQQPMMNSKKALLKEINSLYKRIRSIILMKRVREAFIIISRTL